MPSHLRSYKWIRGHFKLFQGKAHVHLAMRDGGLVVRLRTLDRRVPGSNPARTVRFFWAKNWSPVCSSSPRCINGYPDRAVFVQVCYSLSAISRCTLLENGREIVSLGRLDFRFHKVAQWSRGVVSKGGWTAVELKVALENRHLTLT